MKKIITIIFALFAVVSFAFGQDVQEEYSGVISNPLPVAPKYGYCSFSTILQRHPSYILALDQLKKLREQYEKEAQHNEIDFRRQFSEYLNGQKDFPQAILLKRQRDLQESMEKGLAFRAEADSLLAKAEEDLLSPIRSMIEAAIRAVAEEHGYECVVNIDEKSYLYLSPALSEDITLYVEEKLK